LISSLLVWCLFCAAVSSRLVSCGWPSLLDYGRVYSFRLTHSLLDYCFYFCPLSESQLLSLISTTHCGCNVVARVCGCSCCRNDQQQQHWTQHCWNWWHIGTGMRMHLRVNRSAICLGTNRYCYRYCNPCIRPRPLESGTGHPWRCNRRFFEIGPATLGGTTGGTRVILKYRNVLSRLRNGLRLHMAVCIE